MAYIYDGEGSSMAFKDFYIAVGEPGAYSESMEYEVPPIGVFADYNIRIKHAPLAVMPKIKNVVVQSWKDEDGDDIWLPFTTDDNGKKIPAVTHEATEYTPTFVFFSPNNGQPIATQNIRALMDRIKGRWLKLWDEYTQLGYTGCVLLNPDEDPKFKRRNYDYVEFQLTFRVNGTCVDTPFAELFAQ